MHFSFPDLGAVLGARHQEGHPLVIAFHGHGGRMASSSARMNLQALWPRAIVVYPQGRDTPSVVDPGGTGPGWQHKAGDQGDRDLELFDAIVATMKQSYGVDERQIYATGHSNGAVFSLLLWARRAPIVAAIGEVAGRLHPSETLTSPRPLVAVAGRRDPVARFAVQRRTIELAKAVNGSAAGLPCGRHCTLFPSAGGRAPVKALVHPGGHEYPSWASAEIVAFFKSHRQP